MSPTSSKDCRWGDRCPLPRQPMGWRVLGMGGKAVKTDSLCVGHGQIRAERRAGCSCPHCHSVSVTGVREFNSQHANHLEQSTELFVSSPFISFPCPHNHPLLTLGVLLIFFFFQKAGGTWTKDYRGCSHFCSSDAVFCRLQSLALF